MGIDQLSGGSFYADPLGWVLRDDVPVTNPNIFAFGKPGLGKSATTKAFCLRMMPFGYRVLILGDPKDEYERLCRALGVEPFVVGPGHPARINPLSMGPLGHRWDHLDRAEAKRRAAIIFGRWLTLVRGLVGSMRIGSLHVPFGPTEATAVRHCLELLTGYATGASHLHETTIPQLWQLLTDPTPELVARCEYADRRHFTDQTRLLRDAIGQLVKGTLAGMFDDHTTIDVDWNAPIQSLSLSRLEGLGDEAVGIALLCLNSWGRGLRELPADVSSPDPYDPYDATTLGLSDCTAGRRGTAHAAHPAFTGRAGTQAPGVAHHRDSQRAPRAVPGDLRIVVRDESWRQLRLGPEAVKSFDADLRLSRGSAGRGGDIQFAVAHKPSDLLAAGDTGSQANTIARDLLDLANIKILHGQNPKVARELDTMLGLGPVAQDLVTGWANHAKGRALWRAGESTFKVQTVLHPAEQELTWTNDAIQDAR